MSVENFNPPGSIVDIDEVLADEISTIHLESSRKLTPSQQLWLEALHFAINEYIGSPVRSIKEDASNWIHSKRTDFASFVFVCGIFDFDAQILRNGIDLMAHKIGRIRQNGGKGERKIEHGLHNGRRGHNPWSGNLSFT